MRNKLFSIAVKGCSAVVLAAIFAAPNFAYEVEDDFVKVTIKGKLKTGIMAIGGETTGTMISSGNIHWELDCSKNKNAMAMLEKLNGKTVYVMGKLEKKKGVEIRQRWIVLVDYLGTDPPKLSGKASGKKSWLLDKDGNLKHGIVIRDAQGGFAGFSGFQTTIGESGKWKRQSFLNEDLRDPDKKGEFNKKQLAEIARIVEKYGFAKLPESLGKPVGANPRVLSVKIGNRKSTLTLPPGGTVRVGDDVAKLDEGQRLFGMVQEINKILQK